MNFKVIRTENEGQWFSTFCTDWEFNLEYIKEKFPGMMIEKAQVYQDGLFIDLYFHFHDKADEAYFILLAEALQQEE